MVFSCTNQAKVAAKAAAPLANTGGRRQEESLEGQCDRRLTHLRCEKLSSFKEPHK